MKAITNKSRTELINSEQTIDIMEERRSHRISLMCRRRDVSSSRKDLIFFIKLLVDDLEKTDPALRANIVKVRDVVLVLIYSISHSTSSHASFLSSRSFVNVFQEIVKDTQITHLSFLSSRDAYGVSWGKPAG
jgi:hypothetical protein